MENLLTAWGKNAGAPALIAAALPDERAHYHFAQMLRALVKEYVPVTHWKDILETVRKVAFVNDDVSEAIRAVRLRLKQLLPGNDPNTPRFELPSDLENSISSGLRLVHGRTLFSVSAEEGQKIQSMLLDLLRSIESVASPRNWHIALVTRSSEIRLFVRYLIDNTFPNLLNLVVLSQEELFLPDELATVAGAGDEDKAKGVKNDEQ